VFFFSVFFRFIPSILVFHPFLYFLIYSEVHQTFLCRVLSASDQSVGIILLPFAVSIAFRILLHLLLYVPFMVF
jgi:hypothetical protein